MKLFILLSTVILFALTGECASLNENRNGTSNGSDTSSEMPLAMFYQYEYLLPYVAKRVDLLNTVFSEGINYASKAKRCSTALKTILGDTILLFKPENISASFGSANNGQLERITPNGINECEVPVTGEVIGVTSFSQMTLKGSGRLTNVNISFYYDSMNGSLVAKRDGKPWFIVGEFNIFSLFGGRAMVKTDGANFTIYRGFWNDAGDRYQDKYEKEVRYACGLIEKAKALKGKKISENEARTYFANITPCSYTPNISSGTVIFDLQQNIVLGQKIVLNEKSSKEKSSSSSSQELRY